MIYLYDGTFDGLLSVVFETYRLKAPATRIVPDFAWQDTLFDEPIPVSTHPEWVQRVRAGLRRCSSAKTVTMLYRCFLSEQDGVEWLIYDYIRKTMAANESIEGNFMDDTVLRLQQLDKMMGREIHRMHAFTRFQQTKDGIYVSVIEPDFDVLPLIIDHFERRYPAQTWLIYDTKRHYGMFYDQQQRKTTAVTFAEADHRQLRQLSPSILEDTETSYQEAWKLYFKSTNIPERKNMKLHLQHVPRRYWKYLVEKV